ncbi:hypothetical protein, conserved [Angomonas deanei]|uniref:Flagellar attachment zone protein 1 conserved domain-containing protein n=1 Tax=Angomonas deanei TaxID=59799 RepID=A0A7G2CNF7_9TRYP|nr:hypothetical protein, conserved [Angomonas deanei]
MKVELSANDGLVVEYEVRHPSHVSGEDIAQRIDDGELTNTWALYHEELRQTSASPRRSSVPTARRVSYKPLRAADYEAPRHSTLPPLQAQEEESPAATTTLALFCEGDRWPAVLKSRPADLTDAVRRDIALAAGTSPRDVTKVELSANDGLVVEYEVRHPSHVSGEDIAQRIDDGELTSTWALYHEELRQTSASPRRSSVPTARRVSYKPLRAADYEAPRHSTLPPLQAQEEESPAATTTLTLFCEGDRWPAVLKSRPADLTDAVRRDIDLAAGTSPRDVTKVELSANDGLVVEYEVLHPSHVSGEDIAQRIDDGELANTWALYHEELRQTSASPRRSSVPTARRVSYKPLRAADYEAPRHSTLPPLQAQEEESPAATTTLALFCEGDRWPAVLKSRPADLTDAVRRDIALAAGTSPRDVTKVELSANDGLVVEYEVRHPSHVSGEDIAQRIDDGELANTWALYHEELRQTSASPRRSSVPTARRVSYKPLRAADYEAPVTAPCHPCRHRRRNPPQPPRRWPYSARATAGLPC